MILLRELNVVEGPVLDVLPIYATSSYWKRGYLHIQNLHRDFRLQTMHQQPSHSLRAIHTVKRKGKSWSGSNGDDVET